MLAQPADGAPAQSRKFSIVVVQRRAHRRIRVFMLTKCEQSKSDQLFSRPIHQGWTEAQSGLTGKRATEMLLWTPADTTSDETDNIGHYLQESSKLKHWCYESLVVPEYHTVMRYGV